MARRPAAVYVISVAAELSGMHPQTLRIYERRGLVEPARTAGGSRRYSDADVALLLRISDLTSLGMNLVGVKKVLDLEARIAALESEVASLRSRSRVVNEAVRETERSYRRDLVPLRQTVTIYEAD